MFSMLLCLVTSATSILIRASVVCALESYVIFNKFLTQLPDKILQNGSENWNHWPF